VMINLKEKNVPTTGNWIFSGNALSAGIFSIPSRVGTNNSNNSQIHHKSFSGASPTTVYGLAPFLNAI
jgi:hypothetical protein